MAHLLLDACISYVFALSQRQHLKAPGATLADEINISVYFLVFVLNWIVILQRALSLGGQVHVDYIFADHEIVGHF